MPDNSINRDIERFPSDSIDLTRLSISWSDHDAAARICRQIADQRPQLKRVHLKLQYGATDSDLDGFLTHADGVAFSDGTSLLFRLTEFDLSDATITDVGFNRFAEIALRGKFPNLKSLDLGRTSITDQSFILFANAVQSRLIPMLRELDLRKTHITDLSVLHFSDACSHGTSPHLRSLNVSSTHVGDLGAKSLARAAALGAFPRLEVMDFWKSRLGDEGLLALVDAVEASNLPQLTTLLVADSKITTLHPAILASHDVYNIVEAVRDGVPYYEVRVLFVGMESVGKTSLFRRTFLDKVGGGAEKASTFAINFISASQCIWKPTYFGENGFEAQVEPFVWDFAGQEIFHGIHESLLCKDDRTICILVLDSTRDAQSIKSRGWERGNRLKYWLKLISHSVGTDAPIVIAITKCDQYESNDDRAIDTQLIEVGTSLTAATPSQLEEAFGAHVCEVVDGCSARDPNRSIAGLRAAIERSVNRIDIAKGAFLPRRLIRIRGFIERVFAAAAMIPYDDLEHACRLALNQGLPKAPEPTRLIWNPVLDHFKRFGYDVSEFDALIERHEKSLSERVPFFEAEDEIRVPFCETKDGIRVPFEIEDEIEEVPTANNSGEATPYSETAFATSNAHGILSRE